MATSTGQLHITTTGSYVVGSGLQSDIWYTVQHNGNGRTIIMNSNKSIAFDGVGDYLETNSDDGWTMMVNGTTGKQAPLSPEDELRTAIDQAVRKIRES